MISLYKLTKLVGRWNCIGKVKIRVKSSVKTINKLWKNSEPYTVPIYQYFPQNHISINKGYLRINRSIILLHGNSSCQNNLYTNNNSDGAYLKSFIQMWICIVSFQRTRPSVRPFQEWLLTECSALQCALNWWTDLQLPAACKKA